MKKLLLFILVLLSVFLGYSFARDKLTQKNLPEQKEAPKTQILRFALVADSENDNGLLAKALDQAKGSGVNFVIGLGDWSSVGTVDELTRVKTIFDDSRLTYYVTPGDHDLWESRNKGQDATANFRQIFGDPSQVFNKEGIQFIIVDNSDIYKGIEDAQISNFKFQISNSSPRPKLRFVFSHKTPFHPQSAHVMGEDSEEVAKQAQSYMQLMEDNKVDGFFSGDLHFFARFNSPSEAVKMTTIGAVASERNFQGPRFAVVTVYSDYSWEVGDVEIR